MDVISWVVGAVISISICKVCDGRDVGISSDALAFLAPEGKRQVSEEHGGERARTRRPHHKPVGGGRADVARRAGSLDRQAGEVGAEDSEGDLPCHGDGGSPFGYQAAAAADEKLGEEVL